MNNPNSHHQGLPPPQPLQHPRQAGLIQQHRPDSPLQPHGIHHSSQSPYLSPHSSTHSVPQHHSPYVGSVPSLPSQHGADPNYFTAHPSPYSANSAAGSYASSEPADTMATQAAMSRQQYPPISSYQTPQSNSPASIHSPQQHDAQGRPLYAFPPMAQPMYYGQTYQMPQPPQYAQHPQAPSHHQSMTSAPGILMSHHQHQPQHQQHQQQHQQHQQQHQQSQQSMQQTPQSVHSQPSMMDSKPPHQSIPRPSSVIAPPQGTPQTPSGSTMASMPPGSAGSAPNSNAAPGPIPATTPLVVRQDQTGVQWIAFEYSRDRVKMEYTIRCDVESVNIDELTPEFKNSNCVYPRACCQKNEYKGNRLHYESECNQVGWALAQLNPNLREKRGLIQRAVDSWRNSNQDPRLRSRRVRRQAKIHTRKTTMPSATSLPTGQPVLPPHGLPSGGRSTHMGPGAPQMHLHGPGSEASDDVSGMFHPM